MTYVSIWGNLHYMHFQVHFKLQLKWISKDLNLLLNLIINNEIPRRFFMKIFTRSHSSEDLRCFSSKDYKKSFLLKIFKISLIDLHSFSSKNLHKVSRFTRFLLRIIRGSLKIIVEIFGRSLIKILLGSSKDRSRDKLAPSLVDLQKIFVRFDGESKVRSHEIQVLGFNMHF